MTAIADLNGILMAAPVMAFLSNLAAAIAAIVITLFASVCEILDCQTWLSL